MKASAILASLQLTGASSECVPELKQQFRSHIRLHSLDGSSEEVSDRRATKFDRRTIENYTSQCTNRSRQPTGYTFRNARVEKGGTTRNPSVTECRLKNTIPHLMGRMGKRIALTIFLTAKSIITAINSAYDRFSTGGCGRVS